MNIPPTTAPRRFIRLPVRFSLRALLLAMTVICVLLAHKTHRATAQRKAVAEIRQLKGEVLYAHETDPYFGEMVNRSTTIPRRRGIPAWLFDGLGPDWWSDVTHVKVDLPNERLGILRDLHALKVADIRFAVDLDDTALDTLARLGTLEELIVSAQSISAGAWSRLQPAKALRRLEIWGRYVTDDDLRSISSLEQLTHLDAFSTAITNAGLEALAPMHRLQSLALRHNGFDACLDDGLITIGRLRALTELNLSRSDITDEGVRHLVGLSHLTTLNLHYCYRVTDASLPALEQFPTLRILDVGKTRMTPNARDDLQAALPLLEELNERPVR